MANTAPATPAKPAAPRTPTLFDWQETQFGGATYDPALDRERLTKQLGRVYHVMQDGGWRTLAEIATDIRLFCGHPGGRPPHDTEAAISARLRDLRKIRHGAYEVGRRRRGAPSSGLWEYAILGRQQRATA